MKLLIELPTWLGDTVMASPAIEILVKHYDNPHITIIGTPISLAVYKFHPSVDESIVLKKRYLDIFKSIKNLGEFDAFFSFRRSLRSKFIKFFVKSDIKHQLNSRANRDNHLVITYSDFIGSKLKIETQPSRLCVYENTSLFSKKNLFVSNKLLLGLNPGALYGSAKQWYPSGFASVAVQLASQYDIVIFGSQNEVNIANEIEFILKENNILNYKNLAGKTDISTLMSFISSLDLFITGDSGPMHLAAAFQVPTVAIFGPTKDIETSQWMNEKSVIVKKNLKCQPCMKRTCPLNHHKCMKQIEASDVLEAIKKID
jgi:heptosyltransferase II